MVRDQEFKAKAEVYHGDEICREKSRELLQQVGLPKGLLPLRDIIECGYIEETGFVWLRQKNIIEHYFHKVGRRVSYGKEITGYVEKQRIRKLTGVKGKELMMWLTLSDISIDDSTTGLLTCRTPSGIVRSFPASAFNLTHEDA
ncbi:hypothetical protein FCM35_KLT09352 [Carex littledalei]|uniref:DUF538 domain-containing protein n=1 Tax=Carex littledalei TaxID=544730 RepID=A0A833RTI8_9POAL|nr:hypothetical protein FCM35_KLT09352 [Carex littledalei]